jgi:hypothetical protein
MTAEEKSIMELTIKNAMLEGFNKFAETMDAKVQNEIAAHKQNCSLATPRSGSFADTIKDWKTVAATIIGIAWVISTTITVLSGKPLTSFTPEQVKQVAQQVQQVINPIPVTGVMGNDNYLENATK